MSIKIVDVANTIWASELNQSDTTDIPSIAYWLRSVGVPKLNDLIYTNFDIDESTLEIQPAESFGFDEMAILIQLYMIKFFQRQSSNMLSAAGAETILEYSENGMTIRKINRGTLGQQWNMLQKDAQTELNNMVNGYKIKRSTPLAIGGEETLLLSSYIPKYNRILNNGF